MEEKKNIHQEDPLEKVVQQAENESAETPKKGRGKRSPVERFLRFVCILLFSPILLFLVLTLLLYIPFVQDWAVGIACERISEATGLDVEVQRLRLSFPLDVDLQGLLIMDGKHILTSGRDEGVSSYVAPSDTVLAVDHCIVDLDLSEIFSWNLGVDAVDFKGVVADTHSLIASMNLRGRLEEFHLDAHNLEIENKRVNITAAALKGCDLDLALRDTSIVDTTTSAPLEWMLDFSHIQLEDTRLAFHTARDTMSVFANVRKMGLESGHFDLRNNLLHIEDLCLATDSLVYDMTYVPRIHGVDWNHLTLCDLSTRLEKLDYNLDEVNLCAVLPQLSFREKSGLRVDDFAADVCLDSKGVKIHDAQLRTPTSTLRAKADIGWDALQVKGDGSLDARLSADLSREDVLRLAGPYMPASLRANYPNKKLTAEVEVVGNVSHVAVRAFRVLIPGMVDAKVSGQAKNLLDNGRFAADLRWDVHTQDLSLVQRLTGLTSVNLPPMDVAGTTHIAPSKYQADITLRQGSGSLAVKGTFFPKGNVYNAQVEVDRFAVTNFIPMDKSLQLTAHASVAGSGFDFFSKQTRLKAMLDMPSVHYGTSNISDVHLDAQLAKGDCLLNFYSAGDLVDADGCLELTLDKRKVENASFAFDMRGLDLHALGVTQNPFKASMTMHLQGNTNLTTTHYVKGDISAIQLALKDSTFYPRDISLESLLTPDTTFAFLSAGDLLFRLNSTDGLSKLMSKSTVFADSVIHQMESKQFDQRRLLPLLPTADLCIQSGDKNPAANLLLSMAGYTYHEMDIDFHTDPHTGIVAEGHVYGTNTGKIVLDTIVFDLKQDTIATLLNARVCNGKKNKDVTFDALLKADLCPGKVNLGLLYFDSDKRKGVDLGGELQFHNGERRLHITPLRPILAYRYFTLNDDNYVLLHADGRIDANLDMLADDGTGLKLYSMPNDDAEQDLTASLNHFNVGELCSVLPYMPRISGLLHGDLHYLVQDKITSIMADLTVNDMAYEGTPMGNVALNAAYMPNEDGSHFVDGYVSQNDREVLSFNGTYQSKDDTDDIDANVTFQRFPLTMANGFLGETVQLTGSLLGEVNVTGSTSHPRFDGAVYTDSLHVLSPLYSVNMRVPNDTIQVMNSRLNIKQMKGYTTGVNPMTIDGSINFADFDNIQLDIRARAKNFELINAPKNRKAVAYGKVYVDLDTRVKGSLQNLAVTGNLGVLGNTNVTYVLLDSPITVEDEMSDLVTFVDFSDTLQVEEPVVTPPSNLKMQMKISIDQRANVNCLLSPDGANYVKLEGGGDLNMTYDVARGLQMTGRYTILQGKMTYTLMVVSVKDCQILNGSYVEFTGDIGNPRLKIDAVERVNSTITENQSPRTVAFDVGLSITQTLSNMGLTFTLEAPEDMTLQNAIAQMTDEQRSRVAVTLMATGMYIVEGQESGGFNTTNALNTFLQSQISSITGKALNTFDISLGVQNNATSTGSTTTDYSFRFAKRFWGNRISLIVGGKVSSGREAQNTGESLIDNVSIEYRLDKSATRYVTLFYDKNNESVLEGKITEMGAGLVLRRKTNHLGELFLFRNKDVQPATDDEPWRFVGNGQQATDDEQSTTGDGR